MTERAVEPAVVPWALGRVSEIPGWDPVELSYAGIEIDPVTQTARYRAADGSLVDPIEAGKHGTIRNTYKPVPTGKDGKSDTDTHPDATRD